MGGASAIGSVARRVRWGRILRGTGNGMLAAGLGGVGYATVSAVRSGARAVDALRCEAEDDGVSSLYMRLTGKLPLHSRVLQDRKELTDYLYDRVDREAKNPIERRLGRSAADNVVNQISGGGNAAYLGRDRIGRPVFAFPKGKMGRRVVLHEVGHYLASKKRTGDAAYAEEYNRGADSEASLHNLFRSRLKRDSAGNLTRYGMEAEAWDLGGVPEGDSLREAALGTYDSASRFSRSVKAGGLAWLLGSVLRAAGKARRLA